MRLAPRGLSLTDTALLNSVNRVGTSLGVFLPFSINLVEKEPAVCNVRKVYKYAYFVIITQYTCN